MIVLKSEDVTGDNDARDDPEEYNRQEFRPADCCRGDEVGIDMSLWGSNNESKKELAALSEPVKHVECIGLQ